MDETPQQGGSWRGVNVGAEMIVAGRTGRYSRQSPRVPGSGSLSRVCRQFAWTFGFVGFGMLLTACGTTSSGSADGHVVFCLAPEHRDALAEAAVAIGVANQATTTGQLLVGGTELSVDQWRARHGADFDRVCDALFTADDGTADAGTTDSGDDPDSLAAIVGSVVGLVAGAVVTLLSGQVKDGIDRRRLMAGQLGSAMTNLSTAWGDYAAARAIVGETTDVGPVLQRRQELVGRLGEALDLHPGWPQPRAAEKLLIDELDVHTLTGSVATLPAARAVMAQLERDVSATIARFRHPVRRRGRTS